VVARRVSERRQAVTLPVCAAVAGVAVVLAAVLANFPLAVLLFAVGGVANGTQNVSMRSLIHRRVPEAVRGRVFAAYSGAATAAQLGATALGAPIVVAAGAQAALLIGGLGGLVVGLTGLVWMRAVTRERVVATSWG
jgi:MFS family permease